MPSRLLVDMIKYSTFFCDVSEIISPTFCISINSDQLSLCPQPMFSVTPSLATNANAAAAAAAAFNPYLGPMSPGLMSADILPSAPVLVTSNHNVPVPAAAAAAAAQKLMRTDRLEVRLTLKHEHKHKGTMARAHSDTHLSHSREELRHYFVTLYCHG